MIGFVAASLGVSLSQAPQFSIYCEAPQNAFEWSVESGLRQDRFFQVTEHIRFEVGHRLSPMAAEDVLLLVQYQDPGNMWKHSWSFVSPRGQTGVHEFLTDHEGALMKCQITKFE